MNTVKQQTAKVLIGAFSSMSDVALYDLAMKIFQIPTTFIASINGALFPKMMINIRMSVIKKALTIENLLGIAIIIALAVFGKWIIVLIGGKEMLGAYPLLVILSFGIFAPLTAGAIMSFVFVPANEYYLITINQVIACIVFLSCSVIGILSGLGVVTLPLAMSIAGVCEFAFCYNRLKKYINENTFNI
jgi:PST family polysaccharide transporter